MTQSLHIKTYFSSTVEAAVELARRELGPDAMLMNSRQSPEDVRHLGNYEVVFAADPAAPREQPAIAGQFHSLLERNGVEPAIVRDLLEGAALTRTALVSKMESMIAANATLARTAALVGPPGRGKTSTLVKLAIRHGLSARVPVRVLSIDNLRVGGGAQLGSFCRILGVEFRFFDTVAALDQALALSPMTRTLTLIDTAGYGPRDIESAADLARCLSAHKVETHLTLRSDGKTAEMIRTLERYRMFQPARLIFTGLDESESFGNVFSVAVEAKKPVSFLCYGQRIPEDLDAATTRRIVELALNDGRSSARAAA